MRLGFSKKSLNILLASSCAATILGIGYIKVKAENNLYSYSSKDEIHFRQYKKANRLIERYKVKKLNNFIEKFLIFFSRRYMEYLQ